MKHALLACALLTAAVLVASGAGGLAGVGQPTGDVAVGGSHAVCVVTGILAGIYLLSGNILGAVGATVAAWSGGCFG